MKPEKEEKKKNPHRPLKPDEDQADKWPSVLYYNRKRRKARREDKE